MFDKPNQPVQLNRTPETSSPRGILVFPTEKDFPRGILVFHAGKAISCVGFHFSRMGKAISYEGFCFSRTGKAISRAPSAMCRHVDDAWRAPDRVLSVDHYSLGGLHLRFPNDGLILSDKRFQPVRFLLLQRCDQNMLFGIIELPKCMNQGDEHCLNTAGSSAGIELRIDGKA